MHRWVHKLLESKTEKEDLTAEELFELLYISRDE